MKQLFTAPQITTGISEQQEVSQAYLVVDMNPKFQHEVLDIYIYMHVTRVAYSNWM